MSLLSFTAGFFKRAGIYRNGNHKPKPIPPDEQVKKKYYRIAEVSEMLKVEPSCIRFWLETFEIQVKVGAANRRLFTDADVDKLHEVHRLLKVEKYTIDGARRKLAGRRRGRPTDQELQSRTMFL